MKSGKFDTLQLPDFRGDFRKLDQWLQGEIDHKRRDQKAGAKIFIVIILGRTTDYPAMKKIFTRQDIMSQVITARVARKMNLSVATNIMKQINSKIGGESIRVKYPDFMEKNDVMTIGIDVCHAGKKSIVGFVATTNKACTAAYSDIIIQQKHQELVKKDLDRCMLNAVKSFQARNEGRVPSKIIIYRDGVGEGMRDQIVQNEVRQFKEALKPLYNQVSGGPKITLVVVNKRINQRMFIEQGNTVANPPPGSIIDSCLVENQQDNKCFDFFLVPQQTTQGCVTPTHFFVSMNESSDISKLDLENLTYSLCYMYSNWSGSIKVPAPCQYAHKIAEYHYTMDARIKQSNQVSRESLNYNEMFQDNMYYL